MYCWYCVNLMYCNAIWVQWRCNALQYYAPNANKLPPSNTFSNDRSTFKNDRFHVTFISQKLLSRTPEEASDCF